MGCWAGHLVETIVPVPGAGAVGQRLDLAAVALERRAAVDLGVLDAALDGLA